jgi:hypothetical protein
MLSADVFSFLSGPRPAVLYNSFLRCRFHLETTVMSQWREQKNPASEKQQAQIPARNNNLSRIPS